MDCAKIGLATSNAAAAKRKAEDLFMIEVSKNDCAFDKVITGVGSYCEVSLGSRRSF